MIVHTTFRDYPQWSNPKLPLKNKYPGEGIPIFPKIVRSLKDIGYDKAIDVVIVVAFTYPLSRQMGIAGEARGYLSRCLQRKVKFVEQFH